MEEAFGLENIYVLPSGLSKVQKEEDMLNLPSPYDLKNKFIVKCKSSRIL
jgi:hypothetical protein